MRVGQQPRDGEPNSPQVVELSSPALRQRWRALQIEEKISDGRARVVCDGYWWHAASQPGEAQSGWHFATGIVPCYVEGERVFGIFHDDFHGSDGSNQLEPKTLSKQKARKIIRALDGPPLSGKGPGDRGNRLEPVWCWHEFRCNTAPCAIFVVQSLDPGETFRWQSAVLGEKRVMVLFVGHCFRELGCEWYRWQSEKGGVAAMLVQEVPDSAVENAGRYFAKGTHSSVAHVWSSLSCNSSFELSQSFVRWSFEEQSAQASGVFHEDGAGDPNDDAGEDVPAEGTADAPDFAEAEELTDQQKILVKRVHDNMGHPDQLTFLRTMRRAKASPAVQKYIKEKFTCEACKSRPLPKPSRPATVVRGYRPGVIVGVDVVFMPDVGPRQLKPVLNIVDWGSGYQALEPMREKTAAEAFRKFWKAWGRHFGAPEVVVTDAGTECRPGVL